MHATDPTPTHVRVHMHTYTHNERTAGKMSLELTSFKLWGFVKYLKIIVTYGAIAAVIKARFVSTYFVMINSK